MLSRRSVIHAIALVFAAVTASALPAGTVFAQSAGQPAKSAPAPAKPKATEAELRDMALFLARVDKATRDKNLKAYCDAAQASPSYRGYIRGYCVALARNEKRDPATCTDTKVSDMMNQEHTECLAKPSPDFAQIAQSAQPAKELLIKEAASVGLDGRKFLDEAAATLK
ncbi:MAG: hypothetical protein SF172_16055 [Burkholderiales bacterium]|nr:hypothetical protein [Burkholderiales bacterium]